MDWKKERDLLIAQTMAFVQAVSKKPDMEQTAEVALSVAAPNVAAARVDVTERAAEIADTSEQTRIIQIPQTIAPSARTEIQDRIANFRAPQQRFDREREEYFSATLARLRARLEDALPLR